MSRASGLAGSRPRRKEDSLSFHLRVAVIATAVTVAMMVLVMKVTAGGRPGEALVAPADSRSPRSADAGRASGPLRKAGAPPALSPAPQAPGKRRAPRLRLKSNAALVIDETQGATLFSKNPEEVVPIASITKLMTAMVVLDAGLPAEEPITIDRADVDDIRHTASRLKVGMRLPRGDLLWVALMSSENRAAAALARTYPGGAGGCIAAMNRKALDLGMLHTHFDDAAGLSSESVSTAEDLTRLVRAAHSYPAIRRSTTSVSHTVTLPDGREMEYHNSNGLVRNRAWSISLSKTGYINEAGQCLVMRARIAARPVIIVLLDSWGKYTRLGDANRIRKWMEATLEGTPGSV